MSITSVVKWLEDNVDTGVLGGLMGIMGVDEPFCAGKLRGILRGTVGGVAVVRGIA